MASWLDNLSDAERATLKQNVVRPANAVEDSLLAYDLSSIDYNAPGAQGWNNRLIGLTGLVNPMAWLQTGIGVAQNNQKKDPDANFLESAWNFATGTSGGMLGGFFAGASTVNNLVKSSLLTAGAFTDELNNFASGTTDAEGLADQIGKSWDLQATEDIGTGEALVYSSGQLGQALGTFAANVINPNDAKDVRLQTENFFRQNGMGFYNADFDIFDKAQSDTMEQGPLAFISQPLNFVAELGLDVTSFIPGGVFVKGARTITRATDVIGEVAKIDDVMKGVDTTSNTFKSIEALAQNDYKYAQEVLRGKGVSDKNALLYATMLGQAESVEDVAKVVKAVEFGSLQDRIDLFRKYMDKSPEMSLALDNLSGGGTFQRAMNDPAKFADNGVFGAEGNELNEQFLKIIDDYTNAGLDNADFISALKETTLGTGTKVFEEGVVTPLRDYRLASNAIGRKWSQFKTNAKHNLDYSVITLEHESGAFPVIKFVVANTVRGVKNTVSRAGLASTVGAPINLTEMAAGDIERVISHVDELVRYTKGAFKDEAEVLKKKLFAATTERERYDILFEMEQKAVKSLHSVMNVTDEAGKRAMDELYGRMRINIDKSQTTYKNKGFVYDSLNNEIVINGNKKLDVSDAAKTEAEMPNTYELMDFSQYQHAIKANGGSLINMYKAMGMGKDALQTFNKLWAFGVLFRPLSRFQRERLASALTIVLSGMAPEMWFSDSSKQAAKNAFYNSTNAVKRFIDNSGDEVVPNTATALRKKDKELTDVVNELTRYNDELDANLAEAQRVYVQEKFVSGQTLDSNERIEFEATNLRLSEDTVFHGSSTASPQELDANKLFATSVNETEAKAFSDNAGRQFTMPTVSVTKEQVNKDLKLNIKETNTARKNVTAVRNETKKALREDREYEKVDRAVISLENKQNEIAKQIANPSFDAATKKVELTTTKLNDLLEERYSTDGFADSIKLADESESLQVLKPGAKYWKIVSEDELLNMDPYTVSQLRIRKVGNFKARVRDAADVEKGVEVSIPKPTKDIATIEAEIKQARIDANAAISEQTTVRKQLVIDEANAKRLEDLELKLQEARAARETARSESLTRRFDRIQELTKKERDTLQKIADLEDSRGALLSNNNLPQTILDNVQPGEVVQFRTKNGRWTTVDTDEKKDMFLNTERFSLLEGQVRYVSADAKLRPALKGKPYKVYGKKLDLDNPVKEDLDSVLVATGAKNKEELTVIIKNNPEKVIAWAEANGFGSIIMREGNATTNFTVPNFVETRTHNPLTWWGNKLVEQDLDTFAKAKIEDFDPQLRTKKQITKADYEARALLNRIVGTNREVTLESLRELADEVASAKLINTANIRKANENLSKIRLANETRNANKRTIMTGDQTIQGEQGTYNISNIGDDNIVMAQLSSQGSQSALVNSRQFTNLTANRGSSVVTSLNPGDPEYFRGWAAFIQYFMHNDELVTRLASGASKADAIDWLRNTSAGRAYAKRVGIGNKTTKAGYVSENNVDRRMSYEDHVDQIFENVNAHLPEGPLRESFVNGDTITETQLMDYFKGRENELVPIQGNVINERAYINNLSMLDRFMAATNRIVVERPQDALENFPMARAAYGQKMKDLIKVNETKLNRSLTVDEINRLEYRAKRDAIRETRKWLYNVQTRSNVVEGLSLFVPFLSAYTFTNRALIRSLREHPAAALWLSTSINKTIADLPWVDEEGNPATLFEASSLVIPLDEGLGKIMKDSPLGFLFGDAKQINVSARSLNVWYGGEIIPGAGPLVAMGVSNFAKLNPVLANEINEATKGIIPGMPDGLINYALPFGPSDQVGSWDIVLPTSLRYTIDLVIEQKNFTRDMANIMLYKSAKAKALGEEAPTYEEVIAATRSLYGLKLWHNMTGAAAFTPRNEGDIYRQIYRKYVKQYGYEKADWEFMSDYPNAFDSLQAVNEVGAIELVGGGTNVNAFGLAPDIGVVDNMQKYGSVVDIAAGSGEGAQDLLGWFMNPNPTGQSEFNDYAYQYLLDNSSMPGADKFYSQMSPEQIKDKAAAKPAWAEFNKYMGMLDAQALEDGTTVEKDKKLSAYRKTIIGYLSEKYPEWEAEYRVQSPLKYDQRADMISRVMSDEKWIGDNGNRPEVKAIKQFIDLREQVKNELEIRGAAGKSSTLAGNKDLNAVYESFIMRLKSESVGFSDFFNRYFESDQLR